MKFTKKGRKEKNEKEEKKRKEERAKQDFSNLLAEANKEEVEEEALMKKIEKTARAIILAKKHLRIKKAELEKKERTLRLDELENMRLAACDPPRGEKILIPQIDAIKVVKDSLEKKEIYYEELIRDARLNYPKFFIKRQQN